ncbi:hypothetical protein SRHO_G00054090 [Serrasalmus rhombeus]
MNGVEQRVREQFCLATELSQLNACISAGVGGGRLPGGQTVWLCREALSLCENASDGTMTAVTNLQLQRR